MKTRPFTMETLRCFRIGMGPVIVGIVGLVLGWASVPAVAQGTIHFTTYGPADAPDRRVYDEDGRPLGSAYFGQLYVGLSDERLTPVSTPVRFADASEVARGTGYLFGDIVDVAAIHPQRVTLRLRAWDARSAATYEEALANRAATGESAPFEVQVGGCCAGGDPPAPPAALAGLRSFRLAVASPARKIAWVSFHGSNDEAPAPPAAAVGFSAASDVGYTRLLTANGYSVVRYLSRDDADVDELGGADLVVVSRAVPSAHFREPNEVAAWNGLQKPVILMNGYLLRDSRLGFTMGSNIPDTTEPSRLTIADPGHPIFSGTPLDPGNRMLDEYAGIPSFGGTPQRGISVSIDPLSPGGRLLAANLDVGGANGGLMVGEWPAGSAFTTAQPGVFGGHRLVFLSGSRESADLPFEAAGMFDLRTNGASMFLKAIEYMLSPRSVAINFGSNEPGAAGSEVAGPAGVRRTWTWNNVVGASGSKNSLMGDNGGSAVRSSVAVQWNSPNTWATTSAENAAPAGPDRNLFAGYLDTGNEASLSITLSQIPMSTYDVYVYILGDSLGAGRGGDYTIGGQTIRHVMTAPFEGVYREGDGGHYIVFRGLQGSSFTLSTNPLFPTSGTRRAPVSAIEIVAAPESLEPLRFTSIRPFGGSLILAWTGGGQLQRTAQLHGTWIDVPAAASPTTLPPPSGPEFYRLRR